MSVAGPSREFQCSAGPGLCEVCRAGSRSLPMVLEISKGSEEALRRSGALRYHTAQRRSGEMYLGSWDWA